METSLKILAAVSAVFAILGAGFALRHLRWLTEEADKSLMCVVVRLLVPCLIITNILGNPALLKASNLVWPPLLMGLFIATGFAAAYPITRLAAGRSWMDTAAKRRAFICTAGVCNYYYIPMALMGPPVVMGGVEAVRATLGVLMVAMIGGEVVMWTFGILVLTGGLTPGWWKRLLNAPSVTVVLCVSVNLLTGTQIAPDFVMKPVQWLGGCAVPLGLLLIGATVRDHIEGADWRGGAQVVAAASFLRLCLLPALLLGFMAVLPTVLPVSKELKLVMVLEAAMPSAMFPIMLTRMYGADAPTAIRVVIGTSAFSLLTIPFWISVGTRLLGLT